MRSLLILLLAAAAWAQPRKPIFPSDSKDPKQSGGAALLEAVCPGRVIVGKEIGCRGACPEFTGFRGENFEWTLAAVTRGRFVSPQSDDVVLSMSGCESHSENFGGTILLARQSQDWMMLWYKAGLDTNECHKTKLREGRDLLVCLGGWGGQGLVQTALWQEDLHAAIPMIAGGDDKPLFEFWDNVFTCGENLEDESKPEPLRSAYIERVEFKKNKAGVSGISITAHVGERQMTPQDVDECIDALNPKKSHEGFKFFPLIKREKIEFIFDGRTYHRSPTARDRK